MKWHRQTNFYNSRNYDDEGPRPVIVCQARLTIAWLIDAAQRKFRKATKPSPARPADMIVVKLGGGRGFTVLGSAIAHHAAHESAMTCPFPEQDKASVRLPQRSGTRSASHSPARSSES